MAVRAEQRLTAMHHDTRCHAAKNAGRIDAAMLQLRLTEAYVTCAPPKYDLLRFTLNAMLKESAAYLWIQGYE